MVEYLISHWKLRFGVGSFLWEWCSYLSSSVTRRFRSQFHFDSDGLRPMSIRHTHTRWTLQILHTTLVNFAVAAVYRDSYKQKWSTCSTGNFRLCVGYDTEYVPHLNFVERATMLNVKKDQTSRKKTERRLSWLLARENIEKVCQSSTKMIKDANQAMTSMWTRTNWPAVLVLIGDTADSVTFSLLATRHMTSTSLAAVNCLQNPGILSSSLQSGEHENWACNCAVFLSPKPPVETWWPVSSNHK